MLWSEAALNLLRSIRNVDAWGVCFLEEADKVGKAMLLIGSVMVNATCCR